MAAAVTTASAFHLISSCNGSCAVADIFFSLYIQHLVLWVHQMSCSYCILRETFQRIHWSIQEWQVFLRWWNLWFPCWGDFAFDSNALPTKISQSSHQRRNWSSNYSMTGPPALCAGMHTKISDICLGIIIQTITVTVDPTFQTVIS